MYILLDPERDPCIYVALRPKFLLLGTAYLTALRNNP
jgi:hypothetical protein